MPVTARRALASVLCLALLAPAAALGKSLFKTGKYKGGDRHHYFRIGFTAGSTKVKGLTFRLNKLPGRCNNGGTLSGTQVPYAIPGAKIGKKGVFKFDLVNKPQYVRSMVSIRGKLKGSKVSGTFRLELGPTKGTSCDSGKLSWSARRSVKRKK
jgi:hypothetical protein